MPPTRRSARISAKPVQVLSGRRKRSVDDGTTGSSGELEADGKSLKKKAKPEPTVSALDAEPEQQLDIIDIGDSLPFISLKNEKGEDVNVADLTAQKGVVMFLVPKADTPGCTTQACGYRDSFPDYTSLGFDVCCLSADAPAAQAKWQGKRNLPYSLISDPKRILIGALGAADGNKTKRSHFIFEKGGKLVDKKIPVKAADSPKLALDFIKSLEK